MRANASRSLLLLATILALSWALRSSAAPPLEAESEHRRIRHLIDPERDYTGAERAARALYAAERSSSPIDSLELARAADLIVESIWRIRPVHGTDALALAEEAVGIKERRSASGPELSVSLFQLANVHRSLGDYGGALPLFERVLALREREIPPDTLALASALNAMGNARRDLSDLAGAQVYFERALALRERALGPTDPLVALTLSNLANVYRDLGDLDAAVPIYQRAQRAIEARFAPDDPIHSFNLNNLGNTLADVGRTDEATACLRRALRITTKYRGASDPGCALLRGNLASLLLREKEYPDARRESEQALRIDERAYGSEHDRVAYDLEVMAQSDLGLGHFASAKRESERSLRITAEMQGPNSPGLCPGLYDLARAERALGRHDAAFAAALRASRIVSEQERLTVGILPERRALGYIGLGRSPFDLALSIAVADPRLERARDVLDQEVRRRALVLDEVAFRHHRVAHDSDSKIASLARSYEVASTRLASLLVAAAKGEAIPRDSLSSASRDREDAETALARSSLAFKGRRERSRAGWREVAAALPPRSALLSFVRFVRSRTNDTGRAQLDPWYAALVLESSRRVPRLIGLGRASHIDSLVAEWREALLRGAAADFPDASSDSLYRKQATALRAAIWDPVAGSLPRTGRVFIVPDGTLSLVDFSSLPLGEDRYLLEQGPLLHYLSSERDLLSPSDSVGDGLLAFGNPDFSVAQDHPPSGAPLLRLSECDQLRQVRFSPLPASEREVRDIAAIWQAGLRASASGVVALTGAAASERALRAEASRHAVLHLATHAFFLGKECGSDAIVLRGIGGTKPAGGGGRVSPPGDDDALHLSGLALAGANQRERRDGEDDGILTAEEIAALDLSGVRWVVLSACDTGVGEVLTGEGVFGLRRAFAVAGARTLIMSLRAVGDEATRDWMAALYRARFERGFGTSESVREASLEMLRTRRSHGRSTHPFFWSGFVATGDWR